MSISLRSSFTSPIFLKACSVIIGYALWTQCAYYFNTHKWFEVPLYFYNTHNISIQAPEKIWVKLSGKRYKLYHIDTKELALYINAQKLAYGPNALLLKPEQLLLPQNIAIADYNPQNITIIVKTQGNT